MNAMTMSVWTPTEPATSGGGAAPFIVYSRSYTCHSSIITPHTTRVVSWSVVDAACIWRRVRKPFSRNNDETMARLQSHAQIPKYRKFPIILFHPFRAAGGGKCLCAHFHPQVAAQLAAKDTTLHNTHTSWSCDSPVPVFEKDNFLICLLLANLHIQVCLPVCLCMFVWLQKADVSNKTMQG